MSTVKKKETALRRMVFWTVRTVKQVLSEVLIAPFISMGI